MDREYLRQIADTILAQMGGMKNLVLMLGAGNFGCCEYEYDGFKQPCVYFSFKMSRKYKYCRVIYEEGKDTYVMQFINNKGIVKKEYTDAYCDDLARLFMDTTGLTVVMPRVIFK